MAQADDDKYKLIQEMSVMDVVELISAMEEKFGVSAAKESEPTTRPTLDQAFTRDPNLIRGKLKMNVRPLDLRKVEGVEVSGKGADRTVEVEVEVWKNRSSASETPKITVTDHNTVKVRGSRDFSPKQDEDLFKELSQQELSDLKDRIQKAARILGSGKGVHIDFSDSESQSTSTTRDEERSDEVVPNKTYIDELSEKERSDLLAETNQDFLMALSQGLNPDEIKTHRIFPISVYLSDESQAEKVMSRLSDFLEAFDLGVLSSEEPEISSWFGRFKGFTKSKKSKEELKDIYGKSKQAMEVQNIEKPKAEIALTNAETSLTKAKIARELLDALGDSDSGVITIGGVLALVAKDAEGRVHKRSFELTEDQQLMLLNHPELNNDPLGLLQKLDGRALKLTGSE